MVVHQTTIRINISPHTTSMGVIFQREKLSELWGEIIPLFDANYAEVTVGPQKPLAPDLAQYAALEDANLIRLFTCRDEPTGQLLGYTQFILGTNLHHREQRDAWHDGTYLEPTHRNGRVGYRMLSFADACLIAENVQAIYQHTTPKSNHGPLLERMGYQVCETIYVRRIED